MRWVGLCVLAGGCVFSPGAMIVDAGKDVPTDIGPDSDLGMPASCNDLHTTHPTVPSGTYLIDPDGAGGDPMFSVTCDMITDGGGWTIVFFPPDANAMATPLAYTSGSLRLLENAANALLAYRDASQVAASDYATFPMPGAWRINSPFNATATDLSTAVSINGAVATTTTVRFGLRSFTNSCADPWIATPFGRICVVNTKAPFYTGFATSYPDSCSDSLSNWDAVACANDKRFSIAVR
jgi:hypothetical protein